MKKYGYTGETFELLHSFTNQGVTLHRIFAKKDIPFHGVQAGDCGGFIEDDKNLSQFGDAWITDDAKAYDNSHVSKRALMAGEAEIFGNGVLTDKAKALHSAKIFGDGAVGQNIILCCNSAVTASTAQLGSNKIIDGKQDCGMIHFGEYIMRMKHVECPQLEEDENIFYAKYYTIFQNIPDSESFDIKLFYEGDRVLQVLQKGALVRIGNKDINIESNRPIEIVDKFLDMIGDKIDQNNKKIIKEVMFYNAQYMHQI